MLTEAALICLVLAVEHESKGEPLLGQYGVVHTIRNRAKYNPERVCKVVFEPFQFSFTIKMPGDTARDFPKYAHIAKMAWDSPADVTNGATYYHVRRGCPGEVRPYWASKMKRTITIGCHNFYRSK